MSRFSQSSSQRPPPHRLSQAASRPHEELSQVDLPAEEVERLIADVMRHMLFKNHQHYGVPVRREELVQLITKTYKTRNLANHVIQKARDKFRTIFGIDMRELMRPRQQKNVKNSHSSQSTAADTKCYVLKSALPEELRKKHVDTQEICVTSSLTLLVVSIISLCGEKVPEETLWLHLGRCGIKPDVQHPSFGDIKQCIDSLIRQRYILKEKVSGADGESFVYELAEKSLDQAVKLKLDAFVLKMVKRDGLSFDSSMTC
ncbi:hypothetical protein GOP47_0012808 [Adiantum capillus-veneris]|uniref:MAGE domain-containing protein n=1 Tax=Adiantum capillus-veneris TaxID=13818 RepID=A0A9D4USH2_ADICA|nr:hypothetical protein GOP47_0012808 [Adiantum capillus-veneris]